MNWEKTKNFLIILFVCINIFLISVMFGSINHSTAVSKSAVVDVVSILTANGISVKEEIIPLSVKNPGTLDVVPVNVSSSYTSPKDVTPSNTESIIKKAVSAIGLEDFEIVKISDNRYDVKQKIKNSYMYDGSIIVTINGKNINISGVWYKQQTKPHGRDADLVPVTSLLMNFMSTPERNIEKHTEITKIGVGYCVPVYDSNGNFKSMPAVPCYSIETADGKKFLYDATSGTYLKNIK